MEYKKKHINIERLDADGPARRGQQRVGFAHVREGLRPISVLRLWISGGLTQAESQFKEWNSQAHEEFAGKFESSSLSRDDLSREIGPAAPASPSRAGPDANAQSSGAPLPT